VPAVSKPLPGTDKEGIKNKKNANNLKICIRAKSLLFSLIHIES
jgi:hypothetical protein